MRTLSSPTVLAAYSIVPYGWCCVRIDAARACGVGAIAVLYHPPKISLAAGQAANETCAQRDRQHAASQERLYDQSELLNIRHCVGNFVKEVESLLDGRFLSLFRALNQLAHEDAACVDALNAY
jgi:hypothetical protein